MCNYKKAIFFGLLTCLWGCTEGAHISDNLDMGVIEQAVMSNIQLSASVSHFLETSDNEKLDVVLVFDETINIDIEPITYNVVLTDDKETAYLNDKLMDESDLKWLNENILSERQAAIEATKAVRTSIIQEIEKLGLTIKREIADTYINGYDSLVLNLSSREIFLLFKHSHLLGIEDYKPDKSEIASAMNATYVTQSSTYTYNKNGDNVGIYVGDEGCPESTYLDDYTRLRSTDSDSNHARMVTAIIRNVSPNSSIYCRGNFSYPTASDIGTTAHTPPIFIANLSFGHQSEVYDSSDKNVDDLSYNQGITIVKSAGNNNDYISSPGHGLNIITVGNYNDHNNTPSLFEISSSSSYLNATDTRNVKPELSAPGTSISLPGYSNIAGNSLGSCSGTSCAAPHVAGMLANKNSYWSTPNYASFTPALAKSFALQGAIDNVSGGLDRVGYGGIDFYRMSHIYAYWWIKGNYDSIEASDSIPNNGIIDKYLTLSAVSHRARIAFVWMNRGTWIYAHRNDNIALGNVFRFKIYDPNGNLLSSALNTVNGFMFIDFDVPISGQYHFQIERVANYDTSATLNMAVSIYK